MSKHNESTMVLNETFTLSNGKTIPKLGYGTWLIQGDMAAECVTDAIGIGYRLIDTAQAYGNEKEVGEGIRRSGVPREELYVVSKVAAELKDYDSVKASIEKSVSDIGVGPLDLMLIHSPQPWKDVNQSEDRFFEGNREAWRAMEDAVKDGQLLGIGVANFEIEDLENIMQEGAVLPAVNQILCHAGHTPTHLMDWCKSKDIRIMAYSPLGHGAVLKDMLIVEMAAKYDVSPAQLCIRYDIQEQTVTIPKASSPERMRQNAEIHFEIEPDDMKKLRELVYLDGYGDADQFPVYGGKL